MVGGAHGSWLGVPMVHGWGCPMVHGWGCPMVHGWGGAPWFMVGGVPMVHGCMFSNAFQDMVMGYQCGHLFVCFSPARKKTMMRKF